MRLKAAMPEKPLASRLGWLAFPTKVGNRAFSQVVPCVRPLTETFWEKAYSRSLPAYLPNLPRGQVSTEDRELVERSYPV